MKKLGIDLDSKNYWEEVSTGYVGALQQAYHQHRLAVIRALMPEELRSAGRRIFDFGCGDGVLFPEFLDVQAHIEGVDIAESMIAEARAHLSQRGKNPDLARVGGVSEMCELPSASYDAVLSFNVLAYLTHAEEETFYREASRVVKPGGYLVVTHSNELFDLFTLNRYTVDFFKRHLVSEASYSALLAGLLKNADIPENPTAYNVRENPLNYRFKLDRYGFEETRQEFINFHQAPPALIDQALSSGTGGGERQQDIWKRKGYPDTLGWPVEDRWKLMFLCSTYGSCSRRRK